MPNNVKITKTDSIDYLQFTKLLEYQDKLLHCVFLKKHNIGFDLEGEFSPRENAIKSISSKFGINEKNIVQSNQIHSDHIMEYNSEINLRENILNGYDGFICSLKNIASLITVADCIPVFIYDPKNNVYANIHSGWRGVVNQISTKAIRTLIKKYNSNVSNLICCIGPNIRKECFLVNSDLIEIYDSEFGEIIKNYPIIEETDLSNRKGKLYRIDNALLLKILFEQNGVLEKNILDSGICTVCNSDDYHSRRVEGENFRRGAGLMMLK